MGMTTSGGSGSGTVSVGAYSYANQNLFTTPNTTNAIFIVTVTWGVVGTASGWTITCLGNGGSGSASGHAGGGPLVIKVGPNTPVYVSFGNGINTATTVAYSYNYVGIVLT